MGEGGEEFPDLRGRMGAKDSPRPNENISKKGWPGFQVRKKKKKKKKKTRFYKSIPTFGSRMFFQGGETTDKPELFHVQVCLCKADTRSGF